MPASLKARIEEYLAVRAAEDPEARAAALAFESRNPVTDYLGVTVVSPKRKAEVAKAGPLDPLNYLELKRLGFGDLVRVQHTHLFSNQPYLMHHLIVSFCVD